MVFSDESASKSLHVTPPFTSFSLCFFYRVLRIIDRIKMNDRNDVEVVEKQFKDQSIEKGTKKSSSYVFTVNNPTEEEARIIQENLEKECEYFIVGFEKGKKGTPHFQGYLVLKKGARAWSYLRNQIFSRGWWQIARGSPSANYKYCSKQGDYMEFGSQPKTIEILKKQQSLEVSEPDSKKARWSTCLSAAESGDIAYIKTNEPYFFLTHQKTVKELQLSSLKCPDSVEHAAGLFIWGSSGVGKSRLVRASFPPEMIYLKNPGTKWWCGYTGQPIVLIDDMDPRKVENLAWEYKIWTDHYSFPVETKGGSIPAIRPALIVMTSQYQLWELWPNYPKDVAAIQRRCEIIELTKENAPMWNINKLEHYVGIMRKWINNLQSSSSMQSGPSEIIVEEEEIPTVIDGTDTVTDTPEIPLTPEDKREVEVDTTDQDTEDRDIDNMDLTDYNWRNEDQLRVLREILKEKAARKRKRRERAIEQALFEVEAYSSNGEYSSD